MTTIHTHHNCAKPLFIHNPFLFDGHAVSTTNATVTFLKLDRCFYAITCSHVLGSVKPNETLMIAKNRAFIKLATPHGQYIQGRSHEFKSVPAAEDDAPDIAIFPIGEIEDEWFTTIADVTPYNLTDIDTWPSQELCEAFGFATNHKIESGGILTTPGISVVAVLDEPSDKNTFWISAVVDKGYGGYDVSGMSGGPVYCSVGDEQRIFGIVKGSLRPTEQSQEDVIAVECERLSIARFQGWLSRI